ncbi:MAG: glycosyltransferase family A protein [Cocleimonas sp.]
MSSSPKISFIILAYKMQRELPRTLQSLNSSFQQNVNIEDYEIILIENESDQLLDKQHLKSLYPNLHYYLNTTNPASPAYAMNIGLQHAKGDTVVFCIDGARLLSPGIVRGILNAAHLNEQFVVATHAYHLGDEPQNQSVPSGRYSKPIEDKLLEQISWPEAGYRLFEISVFALSSAAGWFGAIAESNCIALPRKSAIEMGGYDEQFVTLGGGYTNLDFYARAQKLERHQLVYLLGEGTFHQVHGGVATNRDDTPHEAYRQEYQALRGEPFKTTPLPEDVKYLGSINTSARKFLIESIINTNV